MVNARILFRAVVAMLLIATALPASANAEALAETVRVMAATAVERGRTDIAVHRIGEEHATLANRAGERMTVSLKSQGGELSNALKLLAPDVKAGAVRYHLSEATLIEDAPLWSVGYGLLRDRSIKVDNIAFKVALRGRLYAVGILPMSTDPVQGVDISITPNLRLQSGDPSVALEAVQHLERLLNRADLRIIALTPGAPSVLSSTPRMSPDGKTALVDPIEPAAAASVIASSRRQTLIFTGNTVPWSELAAAARGTDTTLVHIDTGSATQPGGRNFLWLPVKSPLQKASTEQMTLAELISLSLGKRVGILRPERDNARLQLSLRKTSATETGVQPALGRWLGKAAEIAGDLTGNAPPREITVSLPAAARQIELDRRLIAWLPSWLQFAYPLLLLVGLVGLPVARQWFARLWPEERASDYAAAGGHTAARGVRSLLFYALFLPAVALAAAPIRLLRRQSA